MLIALYASLERCKSHFWLLCGQFLGILSLTFASYIGPDNGNMYLKGGGIALFTPASSPTFVEVTKSALIPSIGAFVVRIYERSLLIMSVERVSMLTGWLLGCLLGLLGSIPARSPKCAQVRNFAQGSALPKRDIVDTTFHASAAARPSATFGSALPTTWGESRKVKDERRKPSKSEAE